MRLVHHNERKVLIVTRKIAVLVAALSVLATGQTVEVEPDASGKQEMSVPRSAYTLQTEGDRHILPVLTQGIGNIMGGPALRPNLLWALPEMQTLPQFSPACLAEPESKLRPEPQPVPAPDETGNADPGYYLEVIATAYSRRETGGNRTSTGRRTQEGRTVAVDPRVIPYGTRIWIPGYGDRIAEDCGGAIKRNRIDLFFESYRVACTFGRQRMTIMVYRKGD